MRIETKDGLTIAGSVFGGLVLVAVFIFARMLGNRSRDAWEQHRPAPVAEPQETPSMTGRTPARKPALQTSDKPARPKLGRPWPADELFKYYDANELRGNRELKGKWLAVRGRIDSINSDLLGTPYVTLSDSPNTIFSVQCFFRRADEDALVTLTPDQIVTIGGRCDGKFGNVMLKECFFPQ